jgi:hexosaminidase
VTLGTVSVKYDWLFNPQSIVVSTSEDGETFTEIARASFKPEGENDSNEVKEYTLSFPETSARYLKVWAETITNVPEWHDGAGKPGFLFVDEIVVR